MIKVNSEADKVCVAKAREAGQEHLFEGWDELSQDDQRGLLRDLRSINFPLVKRLLHQHGFGQNFHLFVAHFQLIYKFGVGSVFWRKGSGLHLMIDDLLPLFL